AVDQRLRTAASSVASAEGALSLLFLASASILAWSADMCFSTLACVSFHICPDASSAASDSAVWAASSVRLPAVAVWPFPAAAKSRVVVRPRIRDRFAMERLLDGLRPYCKGFPLSTF